MDKLAAQVAEKMGMVILPDEFSAYEGADTGGAWGRRYVFGSGICQESLAYRALKEMADHSDEGRMLAQVLVGREPEAIFQAYLEWERVKTA